MEVIVGIHKVPEHYFTCSIRWHNGNWHLYFFEVPTIAPWISELVYTCRQLLPNCKIYVPLVTTKEGLGLVHDIRCFVHAVSIAFTVAKKDLVHLIKPTTQVPKIMEDSLDYLVQLDVDITSLQFIDYKTLPPELARVVLTFQNRQFYHELPKALLEANVSNGHTEKTLSEVADRRHAAGLAALRNYYYSESARTMVAMKSVDYILNPDKYNERFGHLCAHMHKPVPMTAKHYPNAHHEVILKQNVAAMYALIKNMQKLSTWIPAHTAYLSKWWQNRLDLDWVLSPIG